MRSCCRLAGTELPDDDNKVGQQMRRERNVLIGELKEDYIYRSRDTEGGRTVQYTRVSKRHFLFQTRRAFALQ
jgi:hypothetical protein